MTSTNPRGKSPTDTDDQRTDHEIVIDGETIPTTGSTRASALREAADICERADHTAPEKGGHR